VTIVTDVAQYFQDCSATFEINSDILGTALDLASTGISISEGVNIQINKSTYNSVDPLTFYIKISNAYKQVDLTFEN